MARWPQRGILAAILLGSAAAGVMPAAGFELFGVRLWGKPSDSGAVDVIDPLPYTVDFRVPGAERDLERSLRNASALWSDRDRPASGKSGLLAKSKGDYRRILAALYNAGYYGGTISIEAAGREVADLTLAADLPPTVPMTVTVEPGPPFVFGQTRLVNPAPDVDRGRDAVDDPDTVGFATGEPAEAQAVSRASALVVEQWRQLSYAKAEESGREAIADHATNRLDVTLSFAPGRKARYGPVRVEGSRRIDPGFIAFMADLNPGAQFDPDDVKAAQERLSRLGVFRSIRVEEADAIGPDGRLPMSVLVEDRRPRTIGLGATLSTIDGAGLEAYWLHRNLLGRAERLRFDAGVAGLGRSTDPGDYDYNLGVSFIKPGVYTPDTAFVSSLVAKRLNFTTYRESSITGQVGLSQRFGDRLNGDLLFEVSRARIEDDLGTRDFLTLGPIVRAEYDRRDNVLNPTRGYFLSAELHPFYELEFDNLAARATIEGRIYRGLGASDKFVLAGRAKVGSFQGAPVEQSPPDQLFFSGGGGSVRGYEYRSIGVPGTGADGDPLVVGGRSLFETSGELRVRFTERFGGVGFLDAGLVSADGALGGDTQFQVGAGLGLRYYTGIGAIRVDVAAPVNPRPQDSIAALYIGIGQSF